MDIVGSSIWLWMLVIMPISLARGPPEIVERVHRRHQVRAGETIKLPCPAEADPEPLFEWTKDGESINAGWERYRQAAQGALRVKEAVAEDSGRYVCMATNGFGQIEVKYNVYVMSDSNDTSVDEDGFPTFPDGGIGVAPQFSHPDQMSHSHVMKPVGAFARLKCHASGRPRPRIAWFKDGRKLTTDSAPGHLGKWVLRLTDLQSRDNGQYTCRVHNHAGVINFTYTVEVVGRVSEPVIADPHPLNSTVITGQMALFQCHIHSDVLPTVQWLKRVDTEADKKRKNATITVNGQQFLVLKTGKVLARKGDVYLNKLTIYDAQPSDSGMYVCVGANSMGHSVRSAFLTVLPDPRQIDSRMRGADHDSFLEDTSLSLVIGAPVAIIIVVVIVIVYIAWQRRKRSTKQQHVAVRHTTPSVRRSPLPPAMAPPHKSFSPQYDHAYSPVPSQQYHLVPAPSREHTMNYSDRHSGVSGPANTHTTSGCNGVYQPYKTHYCR